MSRGAEEHEASLVALQLGLGAGELILDGRLLIPQARNLAAKVVEVVPDALDRRGEHARPLLRMGELRLLLVELRLKVGCGGAGHPEGGGEHEGANQREQRRAAVGEGSAVPFAHFSLGRLRG